MNLLGTVLNIIYPPKCMFCRRLMGGSDKELICESCSGAMRIIDGLVCEKCGAPLKEGVICASCRSAAHEFDKGFSVLRYDEFVKDAIYRFKYGGRTNYAKPFGDLMAAQMDRYGYLSADFLIPVPLHKKRQKKRGYNQAELLADVLSLHSKIPVRPDILLRIKETAPQSKLNFTARRRNLNGAFALSEASQNGACLKDKTVMLIDDIFTTGSTVDECSRILKMNGAEKVLVFTVAIVV